MPDRPGQEWSLPHAADAELSRRVAAAVAGLRGEVRMNAPLRDLTSFKIGGTADALVLPGDEADAAQLLKQATAADVPVFVLGGTNVLIRDGGIRGIVVSLAQLKGMRNEPDSVVYAEGGVGMPLVLQHVIKHGLAGLEWAAGIPGTVGGCVAMNAGTRLGEMKDSVKALRIAQPDGVVRDFKREQIPFEYRRAQLPAGIVVGAWLQLRPSSKGEVDHTIGDYLRYRKETQPLTQPNAGCVFKNPGAKSAGQVIDEAGLKGLRVGDAQVSTKHGNFIVNVGDASAADVLALIGQVQQRVKATAGIDLELELKVVGDAAPSAPTSGGQA